MRGYPYGRERAILDVKARTPSPGPQEEVVMFVHQCTVCGGRQLIFGSQVRSVSRPDAGHLAYDLTCWCGAEQTHVEAAPVAA